MSARTVGPVSADAVVKSLELSQHIVTLRAIHAEIAASRLAARRAYVATTSPTRAEHFNAADDHSTAAIEQLSDLLYLIDPTERRNRP